MKKLMQIMFLSCLKASEMIEKKLHYKLNIIEKLQLKAHKAMCQACSLYEKQSIFLDKGISKTLNGEPTHVNNEALKKQILEKLEQSSI